MEEQLERTYIPYSYTYDQFTVFFHGDRVYIGEQNYPIGQCCVDILNTDERVFDEIDRRVNDFVPAAWELLRVKSNSAVAVAQQKMNAIWDAIFALPVYRDLNMDHDCNYHALENLFSNKEKWGLVQEPRSEGREIYQGMIEGFESFCHEIRAVRQQFALIAERYFEPLERRSSAAYADGYSQFYADMFTLSANILEEDFSQNFQVELSFVPMMHQTNADEIFIAEKTAFDSLASFLRTEFYRGLAAGNAPRRCHNCGTYFLLTSGYNTCYCNNIAPGETERTCRKVGAHRKEARKKSNRSPAQTEYDRTYNRLKQRKNRKKISPDEWNTAVAEAMQILEQTERGELSDEEMRARFQAL
ncbi:hypothetical protein CE91St43_21250 [Oscillospiraceae bacterium]|nr:hypothetical protein CE91St43_21250 [Oscillospiraceae bacterium]